MLTGPSSDPEQPTSLRATSISFNGTTIHWTISRIAYTPETYTVHFGTSPGSLTRFSQQRESGDNFTATNLQFSVQLTGLTPATNYSYRVVATNTIGRTAMSVIGMFRTLDIRKCNVYVTRYTDLPSSDALFTLLLCNHPQLPLVLFRTLRLSQWLVSRQCWHSHGTNHYQLTGMVSSLATSCPVIPSPIVSQECTTSRALWTLAPFWMCSLQEPITLAECCLGTVLVLDHLQAGQWLH